MIASIFWTSYFNNKFNINILIVEFSLSAFKSAESSFFAFWFSENSIRKIRKSTSNEFFNFSKKRIREYPEFHQNCHRKKTNSKNLIVTFDHHRNRKRKNLKLIFFSNFFFSWCFSIFAFFCLSVVLLFLCARLKTDWKIKSTVFLKNFFSVYLFFLTRCFFRFCFFDWSNCSSNTSFEESTKSRIQIKNVQINFKDLDWDHNNVVFKISWFCIRINFK